MVLIDGNTYYTLESATEWEITEAEEFKVSLAAYKGEEWIKNRETLGRRPTMEKGQNRSGEDREWIAKMLAKDSTRIVSSQQVIIVAPTPSGHQDMGTIRLDPEARRKVEEGKEKEGGKENDKGKEIGKNRAEREKVTTHTSRKGKGRAPQTGRTTPPITRARKRARQANAAESHTASQDSCTPRNLLQDNGTPDVPHGGDTAPHSTLIDGEGYTPPSTQEAARMAKARKARKLVDLIQLLLDNDHPEARKVV